VFRHYRRALELAGDPADQADVIYAVANRHAHDRDPPALARARRWYARGYDALRRTCNPEDRAYLQVRLANGLALVAYHEGRNEEALALEEHARSAARGAKGDYPHIDRWATPIINRNTAKLLETRFANLPGAVALHEANLSASEPLVREHARLELARLSFDRGQHRRVVELLSPLYDEAQPTDLDEQQELFGRLVFGLALASINDTTRTRRQLPRLAYLLHAVDTPGARGLLAAIRQIAEEQGVDLVTR
jgi:hypothetical protein